MLRLLSLVAALMSLLPAAAQHVASMECGLEEYRPLLSAAGFEAYAFDIRDFLKNEGRYMVTLRVREYADGRQIDSTDYVLGENKAFLTDYPEEQRSDIFADEAGVVSRAEKLVVGCYPSKVDSTRRVSCRVPRSWLWGVTPRRWIRLRHGWSSCRMLRRCFRACNSGT